MKIVAVQPSAGHDVPGIRNVSELDVSKLFDPSLVDEILEIDFRARLHAPPPSWPGTRACAPAPARA